MISGIIIYATGEVEFITMGVQPPYPGFKRDTPFYSDDIFTIYNSELHIDNLSFNYCSCMDVFNNVANSFINILKQTENIIYNIYGDVYIFKMDERNNFITFNSDELKHIINTITG